MNTAVEGCEQIQIIYEDGDVVVFVKPYGMLSQRAEDSRELSVLEHIASCVSVKEVYPVHRLDRTTGGVMIAAKTKGAAAALSAIITADGMKKEYLAAVHGIAEGGVLEDMLFFDRKKNKSFVVKKDTARKGAKRALLEYECVSSASCTAGDVSLVRVRLMTGRTHRIRVQMANAGHPLLGDGKYGGRDNKCKCALWSHSITFDEASLASGYFKTRPLRTAVKSGKGLAAVPPMEYPWELFE